MGEVSTKRAPQRNLFLCPCITVLNVKSGMHVHRNMYYMMYYINFVWQLPQISLLHTKVVFIITCSSYLERGGLMSEASVKR